MKKEMELEQNNKKGKKLKGMQDIAKFLSKEKIPEENKKSRGKAAKT